MRSRSRRHLARIARVARRAPQRVFAATICGLLACVGAGALAGCDDGANPSNADASTSERIPPAIGPTSGLAELAPGVAFEIGGEPVRAATIEEAADALALLRPQDSRSALERRAIVDHVLARIGVAHRFRDRRDTARTAAAASADELRSGGALPDPITFRGTVDQLDPWLWVAVRGAGAGDVLGPIEKTDGAFAVARVVRPFDPAGPIGQQVELEGATFGYAEPPLPLVQEALEGVQARFAERRWRDLIPTRILLALDLEGPSGP